LDRAYGGDPYVMMWCEARGYTIRDFEDEVVRLRRAVAGVRVPDMRLDVLRMSSEVKEKEAKMPTLLEMETILEGALKKEKWALERMNVKYGVSNVYEFEGKVMKLREEVADPPQIPIAWMMPVYCPDCGTRLEYVKPYVYYCPTCERFITEHSNSSPQELILRNHTGANIVRLATFIQTEGALGFTHLPQLRAWTPYVSFGMAKAEPAEYTAKLLGITATPTPHNGIVWNWTVQSRKALSLIELIKPYLMADKLETAQYILNIGRPTIPDTEWRPMYIGIIKRDEKTLTPILLYEEYATTIPTKYATTIRRGEELPKPLRPIILKYTPLRNPITWREGLRLQEP